MKALGALAVLLSLATPTAPAEINKPPGDWPSSWLLEFLREREGFKAHAYPDAGQHHAIGYGHRVGARGPHQCTKEQAEQWLRDDAAEALRDVRRAVNVELTQQQREALASFRFNIGPAGFRRSDVARELWAGRHEQAGRALSRYVKSKGRPLRGLKRRRFAEMRHYFKGGRT